MILSSVRRAAYGSAIPACYAGSVDEMKADRFKARAKQSDWYTRSSGQQHCPKNRGALGDCHFGRGRPRAFSRSRGFSARGNKRCPRSGDAAARADVVGRRTIPAHTNTMSTTTTTDTFDPAAQRENCTSTFVHCSSLCSMFKGGCGNLSLERRWLA